MPKATEEEGEKKQGLTRADKPIRRQHSGNYIHHIFHRSVTVHFVHGSIYRWRVILRIMSDYFLISINEMISVMETHCVFFEVGPECLRPMMR
jgi:hypothetical protein